MSEYVKTACITNLLRRFVTGLGSRAGLAPTNASSMAQLRESRKESHVYHESRSGNVSRGVRSGGTAKAPDPERGRGLIRPARAELIRLRLGPPRPGRLPSQGPQRTRLPRPPAGTTATPAGAPRCRRH